MLRRLWKACRDRQAKPLLPLGNQLREQRSGLFADGEEQFVIARVGEGIGGDLGLDAGEQLLRREHGLAIDEATGNGSNALARLGLGYCGKSLVPAGRDELAAFANPRTVEAALGQAVDLEAGLVADPLFVDVVIDARKHAKDFAAVTKACGERRLARGL